MASARASASDGELWRLTVAGDPEAFGELYRRHGKRIYNYLFRRLGSWSEAEDAFADPAIKAVMASIGGEDELKVLAHLDHELLARNPKPFFGYSDNTNLHLFLWNLGVVSYHGCAIMVQLGRPGSMHPLTRESIERALFAHETYALMPAVPSTPTRKATGATRTVSRLSRRCSPPKAGRGTVPS